MPALRVSNKATSWLRVVAKWTRELPAWARVGRIVAGAIKLGATHAETFFRTLEEFAAEVGGLTGKADADDDDEASLSLVKKD